MEILDKRNIVTGLPSEPYEAVIRRCGRMLVDAGYTTERYIDGMIARDKGFSVAIGNLIAIPHGEADYKSEILSTGLVVLTYPDGLDWNGTPVKLVVGIAAKGDEHLELLGRIVEAFEEEASVDEAVRRGDADDLYRLLTEGEAE